MANPKDSQSNPSKTVRGSDDTRTVDEILEDEERAREMALPYLGKQIAASGTDIITGSPGLIGAIGTAARAGWKARDPDVGFGEAWGEEAPKSDLMKWSGEARHKVNEALGIPEPKYGPGQFARFGFFLPNPISLGTSALGKGTRLAVNLLTPAVKATTLPATAGRWGAQAGINLGLETTLRSAFPDPERPPLVDIFGDDQEAALTGSDDPRTVDEIIAENYATPAGLRTESNMTVDDELIRNEDLRRDEAIEKQKSKKLGIIALATIAAAVAGVGWRNHRAGKLKTALGEQGEAPFGRKMPERTLGERLMGIGPDGSLSFETAKEASKTLATRLKASHIDSQETIRMVARASLKKQGKDVDEITAVTDELTAQGETTTNSATIANRWWKDGKLGQDTDIEVDDSLMMIRAQVLGLPKARRLELEQGMIATQSLGARALARVKELADEGNERFGQLWKGPGGDVPARDLKEMLDALKELPGGLEKQLPLMGPKRYRHGKELGMMSNKDVLEHSRKVFRDPDHYQILQKVGKAMKAVTQYAVDRRVLTDKLVKGWEANVTYKDMPIYIPTGEVGEMTTFMTKLGDMFGGSLTSTGREMYEVAEWQMRAMQEGRGIMSPRNPLDSAGMYSFHVIDHTNRMRAEYNLLHSMAPKAMYNKATDTWSIGWIPDQDDAMLPRYLGFNDPSAPIKPGRASFRGVNELMGKKVDQKAFDIIGAGDPSPNPLKAIEGRPDVVWVQRDGLFEAWHVPLKDMRDQMRYQPLIAKEWYTKLPKFFKDVFTQFTTGLGSAFAPISWVFTTQSQGLSRVILSQQAGNTFAQRVTGMFVEPIKANIDGVRGAWTVFSQRMAEDKAQQLLARAAKRTGQEATLLADRAKVLSKAYENSYLSLMEREGGVFATGYSAQEFGKGRSLLDLTADNAPDIRRALEGTDNLSANMARYWRYYKYFNEAFHTGSVTGYTVRLMKNSELKDGIPTPKATRTAIKRAKDETGDVRRVGGSFLTREVLTPNVPFFGAMVQSWNALGMAMNKVGWQRAATGLVGAVGVPTAMEVLYNNSLPDSDDFLFQDPKDPTKKWSYRDYYWNGFTTSQRINNAILFLPGRPPWEAILVPIFPELSLMRSMIIEPMDALFGFSSITYAPGDPAPSKLDNGHHFIAALSRVLDFPIPPWIGATLAAMNVDAKLSVGTDDPDSILSLFDIGTSRVRPDSEFIFSGHRSREEIDKAFDGEVEAVLLELFGSGAHAYLEIVSAFSAGMRQDLGTALSFAGGAAVEEFKRQARYGQFLFGKSLHPTLATEISSKVFNKKLELQHLRDGDMKKLFTRGKLVARDQPAGGDSIVPTGDPIVAQLALAAGSVLNEIEPQQEAVNILRGEIHRIRASSTWDEGLGKGPQLLSHPEMMEMVDTKTRQINVLRATQLHILEDFEEYASEQLTTYYKRDILLKLDRFSDDTPSFDIGEGKFVQRRRTEIDRSEQGQNSLFGPAPK